MTLNQTNHTESVTTSPTRANTKILHSTEEVRGSCNDLLTIKRKKLYKNNDSNNFKA